MVASWRLAALGKQGSAAVARFSHGVGEKLLALQQDLRGETWRPGPYVHFTIREPKQRLISAAPFADRIVHHALCRVIEPRFEASFTPHSYANRIGRGSHRAVDHAQRLARSHRWVLRMDVVQHFPSIDHAILRERLQRRIPEPGLRRLIDLILASGEAIHRDAPVEPPLLPGDDLLALCRPRGLPIGNLTSQFWSNCYLDALDKFVLRSLGCDGYLRYVDDIALFGNDRDALRMQRARIIDFLASHLRLRVHEAAAQVQPCANGFPWLGFVVYPGHRLIKARKVVEATRRMQTGYRAWQQGAIEFEQFDARVQGWIAHVASADSWGLRRHVLSRFVLSR